MVHHRWYAGKSHILQSIRKKKRIQFIYLFFSQWSKKDLLNSECGSPLHLHLKLEVPSMFLIPRWKHLRGTYVKNWSLRGDKVSRLIELVLGIWRRVELEQVEKWVCLFRPFFHSSLCESIFFFLHSYKLHLLVCNASGMDGIYTIYALLVYVASSYRFHLRK